MEHTPWAASNNGSQIWNSQGDLVAASSDPPEPIFMRRRWEDEALLAVNSHTALVEALEEMQDKASVFISALGTTDKPFIIKQLEEGFGSALKQTRAALLLAKAPTQDTPQA